MTAHSHCTRRTFLGRTITLGAASLAAPQILTRLAQAAPAAGAWKVGLYTRPWDKFDYRVALDAIAAAGFKYAGLMTTSTAGRRLVIDVDTPVDDAQKIGEEVRERGMQIPSVYCGSIPVNKSLDAGIEGMRKIIDNCAAAGAQSILMGGIGVEKLYDVYYKAIAESCDYAAEKKVPITVKPHGGLNATGPQCRKCIEMVGKPNFSLWYDPGNIFHYSFGKLNPVDDAADVAGMVKVGMCIKDFSMSEKDGELVREVMMTPGTGKVDFPAVMKQLIKGGFTSGHLVVECLTRADAAAPDGEALRTLQAEAKKAKQFMDRLVAGL